MAGYVGRVVGSHSGGIAAPVMCCRLSAKYSSAWSRILLRRERVGNRAESRGGVSGLGLVAGMAVVSPFGAGVCSDIMIGRRIDAVLRAALVVGLEMDDVDASLFVHVVLYACRGTWFEKYTVDKASQKGNLDLISHG